MMKCSLHPFSALTFFILLLGMNSLAISGTITSTTTGGNWSDTLTWVGHVVPGFTDSVVIAGGATVSVGGFFNCSSVIVDNAAATNTTLTIAPGGVLDIASGLGSLSVGNTTTVTTTNTTAVVDSGQLYCGTTTFAGKQSSGGKKANVSFTISPGGLAVVGNFSLIIASGATATTTISGEIHFGGTITSTGTLTNNASSTVEFNASGAQTLPAGITTYNDLILAGSGVKTLGASVTVNGRLFLEGTATGARGAFTLTYGTSAILVYGGTSVQTTDTSFEFNSTIRSAGRTVDIDNSDSVMLSISYTENGTLDLGFGPFITGNSNTITMGSTGNVSHGSGYVKGNIIKPINATGVPVTFEVGDNGYAPVVITSNAGTGNFFMLATYGTPVDAPNPSHALSRIWNFGASTISSYNAVFTYQAGDVNGTEANYVCAYLNGSDQWINLPSSVPANHQDTVNNITVFGDFSFGEPGALPVKVSEFVASMKGSSVAINWTTASETNTYGYYVQRSSSSTGTYSTVSPLISGNGTTLQRHNYSFTDNNVPVGTYYYRLEEVDLNGKTSFGSPIKFSVTGVTGVKNGHGPLTYRLGQNYPNPFNPTTNIAYEIPAQGNVTLAVYNVIGERVATLINDEQIVAGQHVVNFNGNNLSSGVYYYRLTVKTAGKLFESMHKMALIK